MVYFVGAGTGAADLITVRGMRLLQRADVIIYAGSLVNPELLAYANEKCRIYNSAELTLEEVIVIMAGAEAEGKTTVRLHTGEPSIYGAVREQMDELDRRGISYESCPGVSACFGAAASLNLEYTLPGVSQTLIITRMEGRTSVPKKESIECLAAHQASMAVYLSAGMMEELGRRLMAGGYREDTPAAIVYKVTWPEEEAYLCVVKTLAETARKHEITKTAVVLVGDAIVHHRYERSRLYAPDFSTEYRQAGKAGECSAPVEMHTKENVRLSVISFTKAGRQLSKKIAKRLAEERCIVELYAKNSAYEKCVEAREVEEQERGVIVVETSVPLWAKEQMEEGNALVFIGACGIAVRAVAPYLKDKLHDVPVLVMDEKGCYVIPILSGHIGGANRLADFLARKVGAVPVITTATDLNGKFAVDVFAMEHGLHIVNREGIAEVSAKILEEHVVTMSVCDTEPIHDSFRKELLSKNVQLVPYPPKRPVDIVVTQRGDVFDTAIWLKPKEYVIGLGCKRGKKEEELAAFIAEKIGEAGIGKTQIAALCSIEQKQAEPGIVAWCQKEHIPFITYTAEELQQVLGTFHTSEFVKDRMGVDNVCERAALKFCGFGGRLMQEKCAKDGMTLAIAKRKWRISSYEK